LGEAYAQIKKFDEQRLHDAAEIPAFLQNRHLVLAHAAYLESICAYLKAGGGSRGSYLVMDPAGDPVLDDLGDAWRYKTEELSLREKVLETVYRDGVFVSRWKPRRPIPQEESWFENVWGRYLRGEIFAEIGEI